MKKQMNGTCVVVADAGRARLFVLDRDPENETSRLVEVEAMVDLERRQRPSARYSDTRPGVQYARPGAAGHGLDDRRDAHDRELDRRFASEIAGRVDQIGGDAGDLVLVASSRMISSLTAKLGELRGRRLRRWGADLVKWTPAQIHDYLATHQLLPERGRAES